MTTTYSQQGDAQPGDEARGLAPAGEPARDPAPGVTGSVLEQALPIPERESASEFEISLEKEAPVHRVNTARCDMYDLDVKRIDCFVRVVLYSDGTLVWL